MADEKIKYVKPEVIKPVKPGRGCLTCPMETCNGCGEIRTTREERQMLSGRGNGKKRPEQRQLLRAKKERIIL